MIAFVTHCRYRAGRVGTSAEAAFAYGFAAAVAEAAQGAADRIVGVVDTDLANLPDGIRWLPGIVAHAC